MSKAPYFPLMVRAWLCSRRVLSMSGDSVKAFLYLLCESWLHTPRATLPNNDKELASMARLSCEQFAIIRDQVMQHFKVGTCPDHKGLLYNDTLLEISRKYENKQRVGNQNAKRSQIGHKVNTRLVNAIGIGIGIREGGVGEGWKEFQKAYPPDHGTNNPEAENIFELLSAEVGPELIIEGAKKYAAYLKAKNPQTYPRCGYVSNAFNWLSRKEWEIDWSARFLSEKKPRDEKREEPRPIYDRPFPFPKKPSPEEEQDVDGI